ncbi:MAG: sulfurtransferase [Pseudomonadota bacterium]
MAGLTEDPLVSASWLLANQNAPDLRIIEATWYLDAPGKAKTDYLEGHIPGAVFFDVDEVSDPDSPYPRMLPNTVKFSARARRMGIGDGNRLVIYDRNRFMASARVWWMLRVMGARDVAVLDGGLDAWQRAGGPLNDMPPISLDRHFTPRFRRDLVKSIDQVQEALVDGGTQIIDARPAARFQGRESEPRADMAAGHMPGAKNVPAGEVLNADGTMKSPGALRDLFQVSDEPVITTCGSGVTAATLALALARLGRPDVAVYDGSWAEWGSTRGCPVERGA